MHIDRLRGGTAPVQPSSCIRIAPFAYAAGGKGWPHPLHPRLGALPLGTPI